MTSPDELQEGRLDYASLSEGALGKAIAEGEAAHGPDVWRALLSEANRRGLAYPDVLRWIEKNPEESARLLAAAERRIAARPPHADGWIQRVGEFIRTPWGLLVLSVLGLLAFVLAIRR